MNVIQEIYTNGDWWTVLGGLASVGLAMAIWMALWRRRAVSRVWATVCVVGIGLGTAGTLWFGTHPKDVVVMEDGVALRVSPFDDSEAKGALGAGDIVRMERTHGEFVYVRTRGGEGGWVNDGDVTAPLWGGARADAREF
ncbi:MAG: SH3 domain-containing protein [Verrucomicrobiota bacterium]